MGQTAIDIASITSDLSEERPGFWTSGQEQKISYPALGHKQSLGVEDQSFWFEHRLACITTVFSRFPPPGFIIDVGGGTGFVASGLKSAGYETSVMEPGRDGAEAAYSRGVRPVLQMTLSEAGFIPGSIPSVGMFDVLEHIEDDVGFLVNLRSLLAADGRLYLTVPAYSWLWSVDDHAAGHFRRYTDRSLRVVLLRAGFSVIYSSYFFRFLPPAVLARRTLPTLLGLRRDPAQHITDEHRLPAGFAGRLIRRMLRREVQTLAAGRLRFGSSVICVAEPVSNTAGVELP